MARIQLSGGTYQARSVIASAQSCVNLYSEALPEVQSEPARFAYYPTPGLRVVATAADARWRGLYRSAGGTALTPHGHRSGILAVVWRRGVLFLASGDLHDLHRRADRVLLDNQVPDWRRRVIRLWGRGAHA